MPDTDLVLCILCIWILWAHYEIIKLKERLNAMKTLDHKYTERMDVLEEMQFTVHEQYFTKTSHLEKYHAEKFADIDRMCDLYRKYTYRVIDLEEDIVKLKLAMNKCRF